VKSGARENQEDVVDWGVSAQGELKLGWSQLTSITGWRSWEAWRSQDFDHSGADLGFFAPDGLHQGFDVLTQEVRLQGQAGPLDWLAGVFFSSEHVLYDSAYRMGADYPLFYGGAATFQPATLAAFTPGDGARGIAKQEGTDLSFFTHDTYRITDRLSVTAGVRYTRNEKSLRYYGENFNPACDSAAVTSDVAGIVRFCAPFWDTRFDPAGDSDSRTEDALTGTFNVAYEFAPDIHGYVSYSRGYKSGGYQFDRAGFTTPATPDARDLAFRKETVDAYEAGLKTALVASTLTANLAVFRQEFAGLQLIEYSGFSFVVRSLAEAVTQGAELELAWRPLEGRVTITNGLSYTDARYPTNTGNLAYSGRKMEQSPDWVNVTSMTWRFPLGDRLAGVVYFDNRYSSGFFTSGFDPNRVQRAFTTTNARLAVRARRWSAELWARNLFDTDYYRRLFPATFQAGSYSAFLGEPRTFGITVRRDL
jgi:outer membrane receptor protein involved in Fe transport